MPINPLSWRIPTHTEPLTSQTSTQKTESAEAQKAEAIESQQVNTAAEKKPLTPIQEKEKKYENLKSEWNQLIRSGASINERNAFIKANFSNMEEVFARNKKEQANLNTELSQLMADIKTTNGNIQEYSNAIKNTGLTQLKTRGKYEKEKKKEERELEGLQNKQSSLLKQMETLNTTFNRIMKGPDALVFKEIEKSRNMNLPCTTAAFSEKSINEIKSPQCEAIETIKPDFSGSNELQIAVSMQDPKTAADGTVIPTSVLGQPFAAVDPRFAALQKTSSDVQSSNKEGLADAKQSTGGSTAITYASPVSKDGTINPTPLINCDAFHVETRASYKLAVLADGSGQGNAPRKAAQAAVAGAVNYINEALSDPKTNIENGADLAKVLLRAVEAAHKETLIDGDKPTTLSITFEYKDKEGFTHLNHISVGDSASFVVLKDPETGKSKGFINLGEGCRDAAPLDLREPGGQLGAYAADHKIFDKPNLNNLVFNSITIPPGTEYTVLNMSDGVTDNLNPYSLGYSVAQAKAYIGEPDDRFTHDENKPWSATPDEKEAGLVSLSDEWYGLSLPEQAALTSKFQAKKFQEIYNSAAEAHGPAVTIQQVADKVIDYCKVTTKKVSDKMHEIGAQPEIDYKNLPGKMDHVTICGYSASAPANT